MAASLNVGDLVTVSRAGSLPMAGEICRHVLRSDGRDYLVKASREGSKATTTNWYAAHELERMES